MSFNQIQYQCQQEELMMQQLQMAYVQAQQKQPIVQKKTVVFFDWDDTLFPSTSCIRQKQKLTDSALEFFGKSAYELLVNFINIYGAENIYIVTNGVRGWVQKSLIIMSQQQTTGTDYWAAIQQLLSTYFCGHVISSRSLHEKSYPNQAALWKTLTFQQIAIEHFVNFNGERTIISIGDSSDEFIASMETKTMLQTQFGVDSVHLVRMPLKRRPSVQKMIQQFSAINSAVQQYQGMEDQSIDIDIANMS